ncbi:MAG: hypothetical protein RL112_1007 [Planctomycetota bacterium]
MLCAGLLRLSGALQGAVEDPFADGAHAIGAEASRATTTLAGDHRAQGAPAALVVKGVRHATIDLTGLVLRGAEDGAARDSMRGVGILLEACEGVVLRGGVLRGYKVALRLERCVGVEVAGLSVPEGWAQRLASNDCAEDGGDWLWPHQNDEDQWARDYGAAVSVVDSTGVKLHGVRVRGMQNGIQLVRSHGALVWDCDASFLSGWGLALHRSSGNIVAHSRFDWCVRGYSHGRYWRGQDSAGILLFERSSDNLVWRTSATHGGDGVFLFAGRDLVEGRAASRGEVDPGGSDRNTFAECDLSFAVANALECTFSDDIWAIGNRLDGSRMHGVWGGYSRRLVVLRNSIRGTLGPGIAVEHGVDCAYVDNAISGNEVGLKLWWDEDPQFVDGPFGKARDTRSVGALVLGNGFRGNGLDLDCKKTQLAFAGNDYEREDRAAPWFEAAAMHRGRGVPSWRDDACDANQFEGVEPQWVQRARGWTPPAGLPGSPRPKTDREGLDTIVVGEWGPWDFESGAPRPGPRPAGGLLAGVPLSTRWFSWRDGPDPREDLRGWRALAERPAHAAVAPLSCDFAAQPAARALVEGARWGLVARGSFRVEGAGAAREHVLAATSDDGIRVAIDGRVVLEDWSWHAPRRDEARVLLLPGEHQIEVEYFQIDGARALELELVEAR